MQTAGFFPGNAALALTRQGQAGQVARYAYAKALTELQATSAINKALSRVPLAPSQAPYVGLGPGFSGLGGLGDDPFFGPAIDPLTGEADQNAVNQAIADTWQTAGSPTLAPSLSTPDPSSSSNSSDWSSVFSTFFGNVGKGLGMRIAGKSATVPLPTKGPSMGMVLGIGALVAVPLIYILAKKG